MYILTNSNGYPGVFGIEHIIYFLIVASLIVFGLIFIHKKIKDEKTKDLIVKISGIVLLICILANRISVTYSDVVINKREGYTFLNLIPSTFCGLSSLVLSLSVIFLKKDNKVLHCIAYLGLLGGTLTIIYPDFLDSQTFFDPRTITGLLHHTVMVWVVLLMLETKYMIPSIKKWPILFFGLCAIMTFGIFEKDCLGFPKAMQIGDPLISSLPVLTSWYIVGSVFVILWFIALTIYEIKVNKKTFKTLFK